MEQLVISGDVRKNIVATLVMAKAIMQRAEVKYAAQTSGGLKRVREGIDAVLSIVEPSTQDYFADLEAAVKAMPACPGKVSAERSLRALKARELRASEQAALADTFVDIFRPFLPRRPR